MLNNLPIRVQTAGLLILSNIFMTYSWGNAAAFRRREMNSMVRQIVPYATMLPERHRLPKIYVRLGMFKKTAIATAMGASCLLEGSNFKTLTFDRGGEFTRLPQFFKDRGSGHHQPPSSHNLERLDSLRNTLRSTALADRS